MKRWTKRRLDAVINAVTAMLAGEEGEGDWDPKYSSEDMHAGLEILQALHEAAPVVVERKIGPETLNCCEAKRDGTLTIYVEDNEGTVEIVIARHDVKRLVVAAMDALTEEPNRY